MDKSIVGYGNVGDVITLTETAQTDQMVANGQAHLYTGPIVPTVIPTPVSINPVTGVVTPDLSGTYVPTSGTVNNGVGLPKTTRVIADPTDTNSKWREVLQSGSFQGHPDPNYFFGWNASKVTSLGGDAAEPALYMGFEADYYDTATTRTMEWYIGVVRADSSGPQFRPFAFTAARDSNADLAASVQIDMGTNANGSSRSVFNVNAGPTNIASFTPTAVAFSMPLTINGNAGYVQVASGGIVTNSTTTSDAHISLNNSGVQKWYLANFHGDTAHYLWDAVGGRFMTKYVTGASVDAAVIQFNASPQLNGTQPTTAAAGTAVALPATPQGYFQIKDAAGVTRKVPYYV